eukprot:CAMPEP_0194191828 /NCGR_PEP_ID=MMETSP0154-20130528/68327_1 /TAXON_ID=1049557 /ORGANISM="Thalassiothrix antarctica, Strain L6-D1" /LENGTH=141 /DNA_ID=CAMNT_0038914799 /DNA_START=27 /DNA_END=448 /DNA_ORIENTATION=-
MTSTTTTTTMTTTSTNKTPTTTITTTSMTSSNRIVKKLYKTVLKYPELIPLEEERMKSPYHVMGWINYLDLVEDAYNNTKIDTNQKKKTTNKMMDIFGHRFVLTEEREEIQYDLSRLYVWIGRRAVEYYLPGSYKIWKRLL